MPGPMGPRSPSPYTTTNSISMPTFGTLSGSTSYGYGSTTGYGSGSASRPSSPSKTTQSRSTPTPGGARAPGEARSTTSYTVSQSYNTNTFTPSSYTPSSYTPTVTNTVTPTASPLRRPQSSPRSPLTSVRNIVAAWKERSTSGSKTSGSSTGTTGSTQQTGTGTTETQGDGFFSLRRRAERSSNRMRESIGSGEAGPSGFGGGGNGNGGQRRSGEQVPSTPRSGSTSLGSSVIPPPFDLAELGNFAKADREVSFFLFYEFLNFWVSWFAVAFLGDGYTSARSNLISHPNGLHASAPIPSSPLFNLFHYRFADMLLHPTLPAPPHRSPLVSQRSRPTPLQMATLPSPPLPAHAPPLLDRPRRRPRHNHSRSPQLHRSPFCPQSYASDCERRCGDDRGEGAE